jgi:hypothetical protein
MRFAQVLIMQGLVVYGVSGGPEGICDRKKPQGRQRAPRPELQVLFPAQQWGRKVKRGTGIQHKGHRGRRDTESVESGPNFRWEVSQEKRGGSGLFELTDSGETRRLGCYFFCARPTRKRDPSAHVVRWDGLVRREKRILLVAFSLRPWSDRRFFDATRNTF